MTAVGEPIYNMDPDDAENRWRKAANARWERFKKQQTTGDKKAKGARRAIVLPELPDRPCSARRRAGQATRPRPDVSGHQTGRPDKEAVGAAAARRVRAVGAAAPQARHRGGQPLAAGCKRALGEAQAAVGRLDPRAARKAAKGAANAQGRTGGRTPGRL